HVDDAPFARVPLRFSRTPPRLARPAPEPDEDDRSAFAGGRAPGATASSDPRRASRRTGSDAAPPPGEPRRALHGIRVLDFGVAAAVPELCRVLAQLGAEVIKIESETALDVVRRTTIEADAPNRSWAFNDTDRGQKSVCLNLATERGRELALE